MLGVKHTKQTISRHILLIVFLIGIISGLLISSIPNTKNKIQEYQEIPNSIDPMLSLDFQYKTDSTVDSPGLNTKISNNPEEINMPTTTNIYRNNILNNNNIPMLNDKKTNQNIFISEKNSSPSDRITEKDIRIYNRRVIIDIGSTVLAKFTDTRSMEPVINKDSNAIEIVPESIDDINIGDIISYKSAFSDGIIIHRVVEKRIDSKGTYLRTKGDNLKNIDPEKIREEQIKRLVVGILY
ncbi:MAG: hypothetical protein KAK00_01450 [Nanoarchaeota archaeon]|nr:hypothetical protein [Nanoarchaeota archaeon]